MKVLVVEEKFNNKKLVYFLQNKFNGLSTPTIYKALRKKDIRINDKRVSENCLLRTGDEVKIYIIDDLLEKTPDIPIVYEDENIIVFNKPAGIETTGQNALSSYAKNICKAQGNAFIEPCHRLDRNTSGLVLFAKNVVSEKILLDAFKNHDIEKHYVCIVIGIPNKQHDNMESFLFKDSKKSMVYISDIPKQGYQKIITSYKILKHSKEKNLSLLDVTLKTGRTHQIRAHLAHIGHPILGDGKYGINKINTKFKMKNQCLSSYSLKFKNLTDTPLSYLNDKEIKLTTIPFTNLI